MSYLKSLLFLVFAPGTVLVFLPWYLVSRGVVIVAPGPWRWASLLVLVPAFAGLLWCFWDFAHRGRGTPAPVDPPKELIYRGMYAWVRNPMYSCVVTIAVGEAWLLGSPPMLGYAAAWWLVFNLVVVLYEEPGLKRRFGESYEEYLRTVPRWGVPWRRS